jgi:hypothetical protein
LTDVPIRAIDAPTGGGVSLPASQLDVAALSGPATRVVRLIRRSATVSTDGAATQAMQTPSIPSAGGLWLRLVLRLINGLHDRGN